MNIRARSLVVLIPLSTLIAASTSDAQTCGFSPNESQTISVSTTSGVTTDVRISFYKGIEGEKNSSSCYAYATVRLSSFPTARLATRPSEIASALREIVNKWGATRCEVLVYYENDTGDEIAEHEDCMRAEFGFSLGDYWSSSPESACWESA